jgi:hypothetical protein
MSRHVSVFAIIAIPFDPASLDIDHGRLRRHPACLRERLCRYGSC